MLQQIKKLSKSFTASFLTSSTYYAAGNVHFPVQHLKGKATHLLVLFLNRLKGNAEYHYSIMQQQK